MDAYWAKDIQDLFRLERRHGFQTLLELLLAQSGGLFEATRLAAPCEISRGTVLNYVRVLEATFVAFGKPVTQEGEVPRIPFPIGDRLHAP